MPNKFWSAAVGMIPFANLAIQKLVIEKNAIRKISEIFGIDAKFIEDYEKEKSPVYRVGEVIGNVVVAGLSGLVSSLGIGYFGYSTHKFCEITLDKFVEYYKMNSHQIKNSYIEAAEYFLN